MARKLVFDGFSAVLSDGWQEVVDEPTFSEPDEPLPMTFTRPSGPGALYVTQVLFRVDEQPRNDPDAALSLALDWGKSRGLTTPLASSSSRRPLDSLATAAYRLGEEFVQVWFLSDGTAVLRASYTCPWGAHNDERAAREALVSSLAFA